MIQRKQTLWFLLSAIIAGLAFILPFGYKNTTSMMSYNINVEDFVVKHDVVLMIVFLSLIIFDLVAIFLFKNRKLQTIFSIIAILLCIAGLALEILFSTKDGNQITFGVANSKVYIGLLIPIVCIVLNLLALNGVKKDIKLLSESDRLR